MAQQRARRHLAAAASELRAMRGAFELCAARVRGVALDAEMRLLQLGVPMLAGARSRMSMCRAEGSRMSTCTAVGHGSL